MKTYEFAQNLKIDSDIDKMLLVCLMAEFRKGIDKAKFKMEEDYGKFVIDRFLGYIEEDK